MGGVAIAADVSILAGAIATVGSSGAMTWLMQYHTRPGAPLTFGSHWRYHLLSTATLILWAMLLATCAAMLRAQGPAGSGRLLSIVWVAFALASLFLGINADPFRDPRYLGHQARETFAHALVTIPLAVGSCLAVADRRVAGGGGFRRQLRPVAAWIAVAVAILGAYQVAGALLGGSQRHAQSGEWTSLVCAHFFEHSLGYVVAAAHAAWFFLLAGGDPIEVSLHREVRP